MEKNFKMPSFLVNSRLSSSDGTEDRSEESSEEAMVWLLLGCGILRWFEGKKVLRDEVREAWKLKDIADKRDIIYWSKHSITHVQHKEHQVVGGCGSR